MFFACFGQRNEVFAGRDQEMYGGLGVNIGKGVTAVVLIFGIRRNASLNDLAEKAGHDRTSVLGSQRPERFVLSHLERLRARSRSLSTSLRAGFRLPFTAFRVAQGDGGSGSGLGGFPPFPQKQTERMGHPLSCGLMGREKETRECGLRWFRRRRVRRGAGFRPGSAGLRRRDGRS